jgi:uncharacterized protein
VTTAAIDIVKTTATFRYVAPFALFLVLLALAPHLPLSPLAEAELRFAILGVACAVCWPVEISVVPKAPLASILTGLGVFVLWIAPEVLVPGYRNLPLFSNQLLGRAHSSLPPEALQNVGVLAWRTARASLIVPVVEELFWRGWLMRWLIDKDFYRVRLGTYAPIAFWLTALLFASEHGPYWDVGLIAGILYNLWMIRTRSIADCILAHAVTNAALSLYVIATGQWQYWQ